jgi:hypothetical protein
LSVPNFFTERSPEKLALFAAARREAIDPASISDWDSLLTAAAADGLLGLLLHSLSTATLPRPMWLQVQVQRALQRKRNDQALLELRRLVEAFQTSEIPMLALKGAVLSQQLYGDPHLRTFADLDILVDENHADAGEELLRERGYEAEVLSPSQLRTMRRFNSEATFMSARSLLPVDYHWRITNVQFPLLLEFDELWERRAHCEIDGFDFPTLGLEDVALFTTAHAAKHLWSRLEFLASIHALTRLDLSWSDLEERAIKARALRQVGLSFLLVHEILGTPLPPLPHALKAAGETFDRVFERVQQNFRAGPARATDAVGRELFLLFDRRRDAATAVAVSVAVPNTADWIEADLPAWLYWFARPVRLLRKYLRRRS